MAALYFGALRTVAALFIASLLWGAAAAAGGAFCVLEKAPYCWGNWKTLASSSSTLLSGLTTKAAGEYGGKVAFGDVDGDGVDELVLVSGSSMAVYARDGDAFVARGLFRNVFWLSTEKIALQKCSSLCDLTGAHGFNLQRKGNSPHPLEESSSPS